MRKSGILNSNIVSVIADMGVTDTIAIVDASVAIPDETKKIDISLVKGVPSLKDTLKAVLSEIESSEVVIAMETEEENETAYNNILEEVKDRKVLKVSNEQLKLMLKKCKAVIRCGECTPYSNIIIKSSCIF